MLALVLEMGCYEFVVVGDFIGFEWVCEVIQVALEFCDVHLGVSECLVDLNIEFQVDFFLLFLLFFLG